MIEKLLKALYFSVKEETPPFTHNLVRLAEQADLEIDDKLLNDLTTISAFNINARYDDYKNSFKEICTKEFTEIWVKRISELRTWIKEQIQK